ncbi:unnamed protein product, partial [Mesorhabditis belari]|uniref:Uncharacterized protein n=1 Tax=Mesorhabditis belari TaxID=2138241 RepID=A0AAF3E8S5_9BILA
MVKERRSYSESHEPHREPQNVQGRRVSESHPGEGHHPHGIAHVISSVRHGIASGARSFDHYCKDVLKAQAQG